MRGILAIGLVVSILFETQGQQIIWANEVMEVSSEFGESDFSSKKALGSPDAMTVGARKQNSWRPAIENEEEFITLAFPKSIVINQLIIAESENPGAIKRVYGYDDELNEYLILELEPKPAGLSSRYFQRMFEKTKFAVKSVKLVLDGSAVDGYNSIDAIGIANADKPVALGMLESSDDLSKVKFVTKRLGDQINTYSKEHNPILSTDGKILYFSRQHDPNNVGGINDAEDIWYSEWNELKEEWGEAKNLGPPWNTEGPNFIASIGVLDGKEVFLLGNRYGNKGKMQSGVSLATRNGDVFSTPIPVEIEDEYNTSPKVDFFLVPSVEAILISAERSDGFGKRDLYVTFRNPDKTTWSAPKNLGEIINSPGEEESPFMTNDARTLYFSTDGLKGYGGADIYRTYRLDDSWTNWSTPENMGPIINGEGNEEYMTISEIAEHLYYVKGSTYGDADIYHINLHVETLNISGVVLNEVDDRPIAEADVIFTDNAGNIVYGTTGADGKFDVTVQSNRVWNISAERPGFIHPTPKAITAGQKKVNAGTIYMKPEIEETDESISAQLSHTKAGGVLKLHHVYFDLNSSYMRSESLPELNELATFLKGHRNWKIEISAHTDATHTHKYNQWMSERRAKRVADYLIKMGVDAQHIVSHGYGETRPVNRCSEGVKCSEEEHQMNRRTEIKVLERDN